MTVSGKVKQLLALLSAAMAGFTLGVLKSVGMVEVAPFAELPAWVGRASFLGWVAVAGAALAALGWIYIDYRYVMPHE